MDVTLSLTHACNLDCSYCYAGEKRRDAMGLDTAMKALEFSFSFGSEGVQLGFFGGEPLMEWDLLKAATEKAEDLAGDRVSLKKTVTTNATLLTPDRAEWLRAHDFYLGISIDGNQAMHDITRPLMGGGSSFDASIKGLEAVLAATPDLEVIMVPDPSNVQHLADSVAFMIDEMKVQRVAVNPNFYTDWDDASLEKMTHAFNEIGEFCLNAFREGRAPRINFIDSKIITRLKNGFQCGDKCNFGEREIAVAPSGRLYPCERLVGTDDGGEMCIGDVYNGFDEKKRQAILELRGNVNPDCMTCSIRKRCMNWCCCINYAVTGAINVTDGIICFHERLAAEVADRVAGMLFEERSPAFLKRFYYEDFADLEDDVRT